MSLDTEVDYAVKAYASFADVDSAVRLRCFDVDDQGDITVAPVVVEPWFLNSPAFGQRLLLNALTSPHVFLGGTTTVYEHHRRHAEWALALLTVALLSNAASITVDAAVAAVSSGPGHASGKDFLGYTPSNILYGTLQRGLLRLARHGIVRLIDSTRFEPDHGACRVAIREWRAGREADGAAWDNAQEKEGLLSDES